MGRLLSAADVERLAGEGRQVVTVGPDAVLSPLAVDRARELGVRIERGSANDNGPVPLDALVRGALQETLARVGEHDLAEVVRQTVALVRARRRPGPSAAVGPILAGRVALVTGASSGIGAAVALALGQAGARVAIGTFAGDPHDAATTRAALEAAGGEGLVVEADVTKPTQLEQACDAAVRTWGRLDIAVANAGVLRRDRLEDLTDERWREVLDVDLGGVLRTVRAAARRMTDGGSVVCVSSIAGGIFGWAEHAHYAAAKAGLLGLARSLAAELGPRQIRVNAVLPGLIETPQSLDTANSIGAAGLRAAAPGVPLGRIGTAAEVAAAIRFLASDEAAYVTGQTLVVDGGVSSALSV
jgi:3-oxoacyl-[acyl-carrier protein] reductase